ncbi:hypothetical protein ACFB49_04120 [Sphingomonas sp. DBB INV C78]|uniref:UrcA family protein n=1 Tax=Sphingomonas sp. DBB INV C78 TaxID=3349434 RepID=UPI0036D2C18F
MKTMLALSALAGALCVAPAHAQPLTGTGTEMVRHADLDLSNAKDRAVLDRRLRSAVETACGPMSSADPKGANTVRQCRAETLARAEAERDQLVAAAQPATPTQLASKQPN